MRPGRSKPLLGSDLGSVPEGTEKCLKLGVVGGVPLVGPSGGKKGTEKARSAIAAAATTQHHLASPGGPFSRQEDNQKLCGYRLLIYFFLFCFISHFFFMVTVSLAF